MLLGVKNGIIDLETFEFRESERDLLMTKEMNASYDESAACPLWEKFCRRPRAGMRSCSGICSSVLVSV